MKIDFHIHTKFSPDSIIEPKDLAKKSEQLGIILGIADHNSISAHEVFRKLDIPFIPGEEIRTDKGDLIGLYINELIPKKTPFGEAVDKIREQGGLVYLPHMYDCRAGGRMATESQFRKVDIVEVFNARCLSSSVNERAKQFAQLSGKLMAAGSDTHFLWEFGSTYTELPEFDIGNPKELLKALEKGKIIGKKAPFFVRGTTTILKIGKSILSAIR